MVIPKGLIHSVANNKCVPFIGSGFSRNGICENDYKIPLWEDLIAEMCYILKADFATLPIQSTNLNNTCLAPNILPISLQLFEG